jgi:hypothetical protein
MKTRVRCRTKKAMTEFAKDKRPGRGFGSYCKACRRDRMREYRSTRQAEFNLRDRTKYPHRRLVSHLVRKYKITLEQYNAVLDAQGGKCAICKGGDPGGGTNRFHVDHDHITEKVRGLLCSKCNQMLGYADDKPETLRAAANYLAIVAEVARTWIEVCKESL